jgi:hypothetical protein
MYDAWWLGSISGTVYVFMYFDMFYIHWQHLAKKIIRNKVHMNVYQYEIQYRLHFKVVYLTCISSILWAV